MFYDAHFTLDVTNWSRGIWLDGTMRIMDMENILLSDRLVPAYLQEFPDDRRSANEALASMVGVSKIREGESARLVNDFILCLEEMRGSDKYSATWEHARSDVLERLVGLCDLVGVPAERVIDSDI